MVNFYNRFIPRAAHLTYPLYDALRGKKVNQAVVWTQDMLRVFDEAKMALADAALLAHSTPGAPVALTTDASDFAIGGVCEQLVGAPDSLSIFFSRKLKPNEQIYSTFNRELLALFLVTHHFPFILEGRKFTTFVDHKPLTFTMAKVSEPWFVRQQ
uniref:Gypsy retrotransposon integrase 1 n=1 Tax=Nothobranchius kadleci TaxID=1051664 RepID=A0A1A8BUR6_NOTKA